jgi:hypothetical protein
MVNHSISIGGLVVRIDFLINLSNSILNFSTKNQLTRLDLICSSIIPSEIHIPVKTRGFF